MREAKALGKELHDSYQFWFRRKYNLSPRDPRFLELTPEEVEAEFWAYHYAESTAKEEFEDDDFDQDAILAGLENGDEWEDVINERSKD